MLILIAEDEPVIRRAEAKYLADAGYAIIEAEDGKKALELFEGRQPDLVVLDLNLPTVDGVEVCQAIRSRSMTPIIMVTARAKDTDELLGLELGADDYIKKPFDLRVLVARVDALLRRAGSVKITAGPFRLDPATMQVVKDGQPITLPTTLFKIFYTLASHPGVIFNREQLLDASHRGQGEDRFVYDRTIDAHIKLLRKQVEDDPAKPYYIQTIRGQGYCFKAKQS